MPDLTQYDPWILSILIFFPLAGAVLVGLLPRSISRGAAVAVAVLNFIFSLLLVANWNNGVTEMQFEQQVAWLPQFGISYHVGVDGLSMPLVLLTTFLTPLVLLGAWSQITERVKEFGIAMLLLQSTLVGVFCALDLILFYIFWEAVLVPTYLLIGVWGGPRRAYAGIKFFLYTMAGGVLMWIAMLYIFFMQTQEPRSFDYATILATTRGLDGDAAALLFGLPAAAILFAGFAIAFAIKMPIFPLHTWLPDAYAEAPTPATVMMAAILSKMGAYGFLRFAVPLFPNTAKAAAPLFIVLALIGIVYGALVAIRQTDIKRLIAYSSLSHLGFIVLGIFAALETDRLRDVANTGAALQMVSHGLATGALFLLVGMLIERRRSTEIADYGGIAGVMPRYTVLFWAAMFASIGLPGLSGFIGEYLILQGAMAANFVYAAVAALGVILGAVYMLRMFGSTMFGTVKDEANRKLLDLNARETLVLAALLLFLVGIGVMPQPFIEVIKSSTVTQSEPAANVPEVAQR